MKITAMMATKADTIWDTFPRYCGHVPGLFSGVDWFPFCITRECSLSQVGIVAISLKRLTARRHPHKPRGNDRLFFPNDPSIACRGGRPSIRTSPTHGNSLRIRPELR